MRDGERDRLIDTDTGRDIVKEGEGKGRDRQGET